MGSRSATRISWLEEKLVSWDSVDFPQSVKTAIHQVKLITQ